VHDYFHALQAGFLLRPVPHASLGVTFTENYGGTNWNLLVDGGVRPLGSNLVTLFGAWSASNSLSDLNTQEWLAGVSLVPVRGVELYGKYLSSGALTIGLNLRYGTLGLGTSLASEKRDFSGSLQAGAGVSFAVNKEGFAMAAANPTKSYVELYPKAFLRLRTLLTAPHPCLRFLKPSALHRRTLPLQASY